MAATFTNSSELVRGLLQSKLYQETFKLLWWSRWMEYAKTDRKTGETIPSTSPVTFKRDFAKFGDDYMIIPMLRNLKQRMIYGDRPLKGTGESQVVYNHRVYINQRRGAVQPPARMSNQRVKSLDLYDYCRPQLADLLARETEVEFAKAICDGYSRNITDAQTAGGLGLAKRYHPVMYAAGHGQVTYSTTLATYASNVHSVINGWSGTDSQIMSANFLWNAKSALDKQEVPYIDMDGVAVRPLLIHTNQERQLNKDQEFRDTAIHAGPRDLAKNPRFSGVAHIFAGFAIFVREFSVLGLSSTSSALTFGATNPMDAVDTYSVKAAVCFSNSFMCMGWADGPNYTTEVDDHKNWTEVGAQVIDGVARAEAYDNSGTPTTTPIQKGSALLLTYSPDGWE